MAKMCKTCAHKNTIGGFDDLPLELLGGAAVGSVAGSLVDTKVVPKVAVLTNNPIIAQIGKLALGGYLSTLDMPVVQGIGYGMVGQSAAKMIAQFVPAAGIAGNYIGNPSLGPTQMYVGSPGGAELGPTPMYVGAAQNTIGQQYQQQETMMDPLLDLTIN